MCALRKKQPPVAINTTHFRKRCGAASVTRYIKKERSHSNYIHNCHAGIYEKRRRNNNNKTKPNQGNHLGLLAEDAAGENAEETCLERQVVGVVLGADRPRARGDLHVDARHGEQTSECGFTTCLRGRPSETDSSADWRGGQ
jgi:hypothetical protein